MSALYIVATPIGNLEDFSFRALRVLKEVDLILCEDTRVTKKILTYYKVDTPTLSYHQHSKLKKMEHIIDLLRKGRNLAMVSDAGTPGVNDPGNKLIEQIVASDELAVEIIPVPGASALICAASIAGFPMDRFVFMGFPPAKKKRQKFFEEVLNSKYPVIFYESTHRILKTLEKLNSLYAKHYSEFCQDSYLDVRETIQGSNKRIEIVVFRELTKRYETVYRGGFMQVIKELKNSSFKGEFVVIIGKLAKKVD